MYREATYLQVGSPAICACVFVCLHMQMFCSNINSFFLQPHQSCPQKNNTAILPELLRTSAQLNYRLAAG